MKTGIELIAEERREQIEKHARTVEYDSKVNDNEQLAVGASMLLAMQWEEDIDRAAYPAGWNAGICRRMLNKSYKERLIIAGALIAAEIDRLQFTPTP